MPWPLPQDYNEAIQTPAQCFADADLRRGEAVANALGLPITCSGNFADVYAVVSGQHKWAVKCFTRKIPGLRERYAEISKFLPPARLPFTVEFKYLDQGISVRGEWYPILKMQWVEGLALNTFVRGNLENPAILQSVCQIWVKLAARLHEANLAHGDLQHGNVLLVQGAKAGTAGVKLVDYDGMCVPALELLKATEVGHPAYQHPQRLRESTYGLHIDNFSHLVIYTALRALAVSGRKLWERYDNGDNLLFAQKDFEAPSGSVLFKELLAHSDAEVRKLAGGLAEAARQPVKQTPRLEEVLPSVSRPKTAIPKQSAPQPAAASPFALPTGSPRFPKRQGSKRKVAAVLIGCLVMAGAASGALALIVFPPPPPPTSPTVVHPPTHTTSSQTTQIAKGWLLLEIALLQETPLPPQAKVYLDGKLVASSSSKVLRLDAAPGKHELKITKDGFKPYVGQVQINAGKTERLTVKLEPASKDENWTSLFDGKSLRGWTTFNGDTSGWSVEDGILTRKGDFGTLFSERGDYRNYRLRIETRLGENSDGGQALRATFQGTQWIDGYFVQTDTKKSLNSAGTGSLFATRTGGNNMLLVAVGTPSSSDEWFTQDIQVKGSHITVAVNGKRVVNYVDKAGLFKSGHIALQTMHGPIQYRKVQIIELPDDGSTATPATPNKATLVLGIEPEQAKVYLDGKLVSASSTKELDIEVSPGKHELKVEKRGFKPHTETVDMTGVAVKRIQVKLEMQFAKCKIRNVNSGMYLDVLGASTKDGTSVGQWPDQKVKSVLWKIEPLDDGSCKIRNLNSGKVLNVLNASKEAGGRVIQFADRGDSNSLWKIERLNDGLCKIRNVNSGLYLDVFGASTKAGTNVGQWRDGVKSILWKIEPVID